MPLRIKCPTGHSLIVPDDRAGRTLQCPRCGEAVLVPGGELESRVVGNALRGVPGSAISPAVVLDLTRRLPEPRPPRPKSEPSQPVVKPKSRALPLPAQRVEPPPEPVIERLPAALEPPIVDSFVEQAPRAQESAAEQAWSPWMLRTDDPPAPPPVLATGTIALGLHGDAGSTLAVYQLAAALVAAALLSVVPAAWDVAEYARVADSQFVARWALILFFLGTVQLAYAVYLFQLPDWTSVWVVTIFSLCLAAMYAAGLALVLLSSADGFLIGPHGLQLADKLAGGQAALWCLCMASTWIILAFFAGRLSVRWQRAERMLRAASAI